MAVGELRKSCVRMTPAVFAKHMVALFYNHRPPDRINTIRVHNKRRKCAAVKRITICACILLTHGFSYDPEPNIPLDSALIINYWRNKNKHLLHVFVPSAIVLNFFGKVLSDLHNAIGKFNRGGAGGVVCATYYLPVIVANNGVSALQDTFITKRI